MPAAAPASTEAKEADVFVVFGITGDLAKVMTFHSLYRLEQRGLLQCPIVGVAVDDWTIDQLVQRARDSIVGTGEQLDEAVFERFAERLSYVQGDFGDAAAYERVAAAISGAESPVFYLEIPPFLFGTVVKGLAEAGLTKNARVVVEKPFGHDRVSARELAEELHQYVEESQLLRIDHYLGKMGLEEILYPAFRERDPRAALEPQLPRSASRSRWRRTSVSRTAVTSTTRSALSATWSSTTSCRWLPRARWSRPRAATRTRSRTRRWRFSVRSRRRTRPTTCADSTTAIAISTASRADSTTETFAALRVEIENWRWSGVPFFIRTGKRLPVTQTELRLIFKHAPKLGFKAFDHRPEPNQLVIKLDPSTGIRLIVEAHRADAAGATRIDLDMEFAEQGGEGPTPYEVLLHAAMVGDSTRFTRQDGVEETWRIMQPLLDAPPPVDSYAPGTWGPETANRLVAGHGGWHGPWIAS